MKRFQLQRYIPKGSTKIADKKSDAIAYLYQNDRGLYAVVYYGKQSKAVAHYRYTSAEHRERRVRELFEARQKRTAWMAERKAAQKKPRKAEVGALFYTSWGYDQTNIDWYEIVELVGKQSAKVRRVRAIDASKGNEAWATGKSVPSAGDYIGPEHLVRVNGDSFKVDGHYAWIWDGRPKSWTAYA